MASGHTCLNLSERIAWEQFPEFAGHVLEIIGGRVLQKYDGVDIRLWKVDAQGSSLRLVFDDFPVMVSLESDSNAGDMNLKHIFKLLKTSLP